MSEQDLEQIKLGDMQITLAELAGFDMTDVAEKRFFNAPIGLYIFEVVVDEDGPPRITVIKEKAVMKMPCKIIDVLGVKDQNFLGKTEDIIGQVHIETQFITQEASLGYINAFLTDIGLKGKGGLKKMLESTVGLRFKAAISHRKDPNDSDKVYVGIRAGSIIPQVQKAAA